VLQALKQFFAAFKTGALAARASCPRGALQAGFTALRLTRPPHMAETITIPSPSLFLNSPDPSPTTQTPPKKPARRPQQAPPKDESKASDTNGVTKRKQSKSRNGCITCKAKRLKCDETKPTCQQCTRRSVTCGGYKKDFKWRPFEETSFTTGKPPGKSKKGALNLMCLFLDC
jgi:hypothetical protein